MGILSGLWGEIRSWDKASQSALAIAVILLVVDIILLSTVPEVRPFALFSGIGLLLAIQAIVLWGNRTMVTPYTKAQQYFLDGEFEQVVNVLKDYVDEQNSAGKNPISDALVLLGNAYRNLGQLRESESVLRIALARQPNYHFALYGLGKIRLAMGDYAEAIKHFEKAIDSGAPPIIQFDLALSYYYLGDQEAAYHLLINLPETSENYRQLFTIYLLYRLTNGTKPDLALIEAGLPFWEAEIERFADTPYGQAVQQDLMALRQLLP
jgi:tetratricopeptide (TPR) repeat protein